MGGTKNNNMSEKEKVAKKSSLYSKIYNAQQKIGAIKKDNDNPYFKSKYFDINALLSVVKPILNEEGLVVLQPLVTRDGRNCLETSLVDADSGESFSSLVYLPTIEDPQKVGSALTYFRRYSLQAMLALEAEDDDGNMASGIKKGAVKLPTMTRPERSGPSRLQEDDGIL